MAIKIAEFRLENTHAKSELNKKTLSLIIMKSLKGKKDTFSEASEIELTEIESQEKSAMLMTLKKINESEHFLYCQKEKCIFAFNIPKYDDLDEFTSLLEKTDDYHKRRATSLINKLFYRECIKITSENHIEREQTQATVNNLLTHYETALKAHREGFENCFRNLEFEIKNQFPSDDDNIIPIFSRQMQTN